MESQNIEYKQSSHDEYLKWVCGFANACFRANMIEAWGSGIHRIVESCQAEGFPSPTIEVATGGMQITMWTTPINPTDTLPPPEKQQRRNADRAEIDTASSEQSHFATSHGRAVGYRFDTVKEYMTKFKRNGTIRRIGADRGGHWQIINPNKE